MSYGQHTRAIRDWVAFQAPGLEFFYGDIADQLGIKRPTASAAFNKMMRDDGLLLPGRYAGMYVIPGAAAPVPVVPRVNGTVPEKEAAGRKPPVPDTGELMVVVGTFQSGSKLLRDQGGRLWEAEPR